MLRFVAQRLAAIPVQLLGVTLVTFFMVRLLPGNPALLVVGPFANPDSIRAAQDRLGLGKPIWTQYYLYLEHAVRLDFGNSFFTQRPVSLDIIRRLPATFELITISLVVLIVLGVGLGTMIARRRGGPADRISYAYGLFSGALPDFWVGLVLIYILFFVLGWLPAPTGRLDPAIVPPPTRTGLLTVDSLLAGNFDAFRSAIYQLILPVATLVIVYMGPTLRMTRSMLKAMLDSDFVEYARANGFSNRTILRYALRNALPPVVTIVGLTYSFLLGGDVLVEQVFSWGGLGQYAVQAVTQSDYLAVQGVILVFAVFNLLVYLAVDIIHRLIDPRLEAGVA